MYDLDEYLHLALHASANRNPHACLGYLKEALALAPENPRAIYLLAIQHAELGMIERGIAGLTKALALDPTLEIARLQLGLLLIDRGRPAEARKPFLEAQASADPALRTFAEGMIFAVDGQIVAAMEKMRAGLSLQTANVALRSLLQEVLTRLQKMNEAASSSREQATPEDGRVRLGAYGAPPPAR